MADIPIEARRGAVKKDNSSRLSKASEVTEGLLARAEEALAEFDVETAIGACEAALRGAPTNARCWDLYGETLLTAMRPEEAGNAFLKSVELDPEASHVKYMYLGQMSTGLEAISWFEKGISLLQVKATSLLPGPEQASIFSEISDALVTCAELYMTDACFEEDAEEKCGSFIEAALNANPGNPEAWQTKASYRLSQQNPEEASAHLHESFRLWSELPQEQWPSYEFRLTTAKLFLELEDSSKAIEILDLLLKEDDRQVNAWYCRGLAANFDGDLTYASECLQEAQSIAANPELTPQDEENAAFMMELQEVMATLERRLAEQGDQNAVQSAVVE